MVVYHVKSTSFEKKIMLGASYYKVYNPLLNKQMNT